MTTLWIIVIALAFVAVCIGLFVLICYFLAKQGIFATFITEGTMRYVKKGETTIRAIWARMGKKRDLSDPKNPRWIDGEPGKLYMSPLVGPIDALLWYTIEARWIGIYPVLKLDSWKWAFAAFRKLHSRANEAGVVLYNIEKLTENYINASYYLEFIVKSEGAWTLKARVIIEIEWQDLLFAHTEFKPKGAWLDNKIVAALQERFLEFLSGMTYEEIVEAKFSAKDKDNKMYQFFFADTVTKKVPDPNNPRRKIMQTVENTKNINSELVPSLKMKILNMDWLGAVLLEDEEIQAATKAVKLGEEQGKAEIAKAKKDVELAKLQTEKFREGKFAEMEMTANLLKENPSLTEVEKTKILGDSIKNSKLTTLSTSGDLSLILDSKQSKKEKEENNA